MLKSTQHKRQWVYLDPSLPLSTHLKREVDAKICKLLTRPYETINLGCIAVCR